MAIFENTENQPVVVSTSHRVSDSDIQRKALSDGGSEEIISTTDSQGNHTRTDTVNSGTLYQGSIGMTSSKSHTTTSSHQSIVSESYTESRPQGYRTERQETITVSKQLDHESDPVPDLRQELASAINEVRRFGELSPSSELKQSGISESWTAKTIQSPPGGVEHIETYSRVVDKDGQSVKNHDTMQVTHLYGNPTTDVVTVTVHDDTRGGHSQSKTIEKSAGAGHTHSDTEADLSAPATGRTEAPQDQSSSHKGLAPHVSQSLKISLEQSGYSAKEATQTIHEVAPQLAQVINEHSMGTGGAVEFHPTGPVAVSLASAESAPQPGSISIPLDQLKAVHESGHVQSLASVTTPSHAASAERTF